MQVRLQQNHLITKCGHHMQRGQPKAETNAKYKYNFTKCTLIIEGIKDPKDDATIRT